MTVRVPLWQLEEDGRVLSVGDGIRSWLEFRETGDSCIGVLIDLETADVPARRSSSD